MILNQAIRGEKEKCLYQVMFLKNDSRKDVYVEEVEDIDSKELGKHLQLGESVFISNSGNKKRKAGED